MLLPIIRLIAHFRFVLFSVCVCRCAIVTPPRSWLKSKEEFQRRVEKSCTASIDKVFITPTDDMPIKFNKPIPAHEELYKRVVTEKEPPQSYASWFMSGVSKLDDGPANVRT